MIVAFDGCSVKSILLNIRNSKKQKDTNHCSLLRSPSIKNFSACLFLEIITFTVCFIIFRDTGLTFIVLVCLVAMTKIVNVL